MNPELIIKRLQTCLDEGKKTGASYEEIFGDVKQIIPPEIKTIEIIKEVEKKPASSKERLEYLRQYRKDQKEIKKNKDKEEQERLKIEKALKRTSFVCYNCKERVIIPNPNENKASFRRKGNRVRENIVISNRCPQCNGEIKLFGGFKS